MVGSNFRIGAHAESHSPLTSLPRSERLSEIERSRDRCMEIVGGTVPGFAYPHGDLDAATRDMVQQAGFSWACGTRDSFVKAEDDPFDLPRIGVSDIDGASFLAQIGSAR